MPSLEEQYQTHVMVRKKNARGEGCHAHPFEAIMRPLMSVMKAWNRFCRKHVIAFDR